MPLTQKTHDEPYTPEKFGAEITALMDSITQLTEKVEEFNAALRGLTRSQSSGRLREISQCIRARATAP